MILATFQPRNSWLLS